ncbi:hypothetical protein [Candidatus Stoquefichus massiliensis]|uniref:hypothetical protein n=1 Tax=Candidatus Stoquefichus massiliensis TaxID=1470350 RepID=UPI0004810A03|nr:hypothetical protein [Candidatus Stoquefichus massiliensis]
MKKVLLCLCMLILVGCQSSVKESESQNIPSTKENCVLKEWKYLMFNGDGHDAGYYYTRHQENGPSLLSYYDYATKQEVVLCNQPECKHEDETCPAYLFGVGLSQMLFVYKEHLYMIESHGLSLNSLGETVEEGSGIIQRDQDGQNKKIVMRLDTGYQFEQGNFVLADNYLYIPIVKYQNIETGKNETFQVDSEKYLARIDFNTGKVEKLFDMKDKHILGVDGRKIIMDSAIYSEDPQKYLDQKDFNKYDKVILNSRFQYAIYDIDTQDTKTIPTNDEEIGTYYQNKIYSIKNNTLYALDFKTQQKDKILDLPKSDQYYISNILNQYIIIEKWDDQFLGSYKVSLENPKLEELKQYTRSPKEPVTILSQNEKQLLVIYDREGKEEKTWAGTMQYETKKEYIGLISIDDYLNNQRNYQQIKTLSEKRFS